LPRIKILYVEDYDLVLFTVKQLLELEGWLVDICRDGIAAQKKLESTESYDLIMLDYELPGMSGIDLLRRARHLSARRETPIIMFTASECQDETMAAGADAFLKKPGGIRDLIPTIEALLNGHSDHRNTDEADEAAYLS
jgi:DNA-binding response OmpR family regulator